jgi:predicted esterase
MSAQLPTILCIHGQGTNGAIFRLQARRIVQALHTKFRFVFVDGPFEALAGPGVLPAFGDFKPFLRWHCDENTLDKFDITPDELEEERRTTRELLAGHIQKHRQGEGSGAGVVGIMAFSQGTRVATGLMLDPELGRDIKFAIMICGTFPVLHIRPPTFQDFSEKAQEWLQNTTQLQDGKDQGLCRDSHSSPTSLTKSRLASRSSTLLTTSAMSIGNNHVTSKIAPKTLSIPSIHVQGSYDPWAAEGIRLMETYFDSKLVKIVKFNGGHQVPTGTEEASQVVKLVLDAWNQR